MIVTCEAAECWLLSDGVTPLAGCDLRLTSSAWPFAVEHRSAIEDHWQKQRIAVPGYFNGTVHILARLTLANGRFEADLLATEFKSYLYWRHLGYSAAGALDIFGSALIVGSDGAVVLGRQRPGNLNEGYLYMPGGFIDTRDVRPDGTIDLPKSVARELVEETGLVSGRDVTPDAGFFLSRGGPHVSITVTYRSPETADVLAERIRAHIESDPAGELAGVETIAAIGELASYRVPAYTRNVVAHVLGAG